MNEFVDMHVHSKFSIDGMSTMEDYCLIAGKTGKEQALADLVRCYEKMMMRSHTNGGYVNLLDECWKMCEKFNVNIVIMYDHVSCKNVGGLHGLFEDQARERGIHLIWVPHDVMDPRTVSRREMREAFNQYMITVLREEPLDPTLLDYEDALSW